MSFNPTRKPCQTKHERNSSDTATSGNSSNNRALFSATADSTRGNISTNGSEVIVSRLHKTLSVFRRERDDLYRSRELALERHKIIASERQEMEQIVQCLTLKVQELEAKAHDAGAGGSELDDLKMEVEKLNSDVQFQHEQMLQKREKRSALQEKYKEEDCKREITLRKAYDTSRRIRHLPQANPDIRRILSKQILEKPREDEVSFDHELPQNLLSLIDDKIMIVAADSAKMKEQIELTQYKIDEIQKWIQSSSADKIEGC